MRLKCVIIAMLMLLSLQFSASFGETLKPEDKNIITDLYITLIMHEKDKELFMIKVSSEKGVVAFCYNNNKNNPVILKKTEVKNPSLLDRMAFEIDLGKRIVNIKTTTFGRSLVIYNDKGVIVTDIASISGFHSPIKEGEIRVDDAKAIEHQLNLKENMQLEPGVLRDKILKVISSIDAEK